ncbi:MAG: (Fe-S)-binding protein, partial [Longimicrobiales bacterium]|nr:(Fe-S)-binding protein [Longimicrobiales bacterium]
LTERAPPGRVRLGLAMLAASAPGVGAALRRGRPRRGSGRVDAVPVGLPEGGRVSDPGPDRGTVGILRGCVQQGLFARVGAATRRTLTANGYQVRAVSDAGCCGALHAHGGDLDGARRAARRQIAAFEAAGVDRVAVDAAGCGAAMKAYGLLLEDDPEWRDRAAGFVRRVRDVTELLAEAGPRPGAPVPLTAVYHAPCHLLHAQGVDAPVRRVLAAVPGLRVREVAEPGRCCGGAGIHGLTHPEVAGRIAREVLDGLVATGADVVLSGNPGCMMQIGGGLLLDGAGVEVAHPVEVLDESYRRGGIDGPDTPGTGTGLP